MMTILTFLLLAMLSVDATCASEAQTWRRVELKRDITHPQPMTGLVLWPETARRLNDTYGQAIQLEFSYCLPCKVVTGCRGDVATPERFREGTMATGYRFVVTRCETNGIVTRLSVSNEGVAPLYRDAWFAIGDTRSTASLRGLLPGDEMTVEIPAVPRADGSNLRIVSDHILPQQQIEFVAGRK